MRQRQVTVSPMVGGIAWPFFSMMYMFTSDTVQPIDKMEFWWRSMAGLLNFLPFI